MSNSPSRTVLIALFFLLMFVCSISNGILLLRTSDSFSGFSYKNEDNRVVVEKVDAPEIAGVLRPGDQILEFNRKPVTSNGVMRDFFVLADAGSPYELVILRDGQPQKLELRTLPTTIGMRASLFALTTFVPLVFQVTGLLIFLLKRNDKQALLIALTFGMINLHATAVTFPFTPFWLKIILAIGASITALTPATVLHFAFIFPEASRFVKRWPRLPILIYLPAVLIALPVRAYAYFLLVTDPDRGTSFFRTVRLNALDLILILYVAATLIVLIVNYRDANQVARRKLRVLLAGWIGGLLPFILISLLFLLRVRVSGQAMVALGLVGPSAILLVPASFAYAVVRHQVIPVSILIRRSVQYLFARNALRVLLILPVAGILASIFANRHRSVAEIFLGSSLYFYLLLLIALVLGLFFRRRLRDWIDRKFFREQYKQDQILRELIDDVKQSNSMAEMSKLISRKVDAALHPDRLYLFYREEEKRDMSLGYSSGGSTEQLSIPEEFELLRFMEYHSGAQDFPFPLKTNLPAFEKEWLSQLGTKLIVSMTGTDRRLAGLLLLGEKKSEVPYTATDRQLLETLADQIAIVYENVRLKERVDRERRVRHEVLARVEERKINLLKECPTCRACFDSVFETCPTDNSELILPLPVERTIDGRYRLDRLIGRGGMGAVYEASDLRLNRQVAVKILSGQLFGNSGALRRFEREAQTSARLSHPNIITVYDYGVLSTEGAYLVMELVAGKSLGSVLLKHYQLETSTAATWLEQVLDGLSAAHAAGVIHRDIKPDNIFIRSSDNHVKILDFGLAKLTQTLQGQGTSPMTTPGAVMGTFGYMSPEQLAGNDVDHRTDLFSVGVIAVEMITGRRPFRGQNYHEQLTAILHEPFHLPGDTADEKHLDAVLQRSLAKDPNERFASAMDMRTELIPAIRAYKTANTNRPQRFEADTIIYEG